ncbi:MAG: nucleotidyltransferase domain-containing protein [Treponema sp.]|jgi:predicted nucleotidyltransferase|nr:nucleotidyltransferase domain-containing protein [Treponema sp.]
MTDHEKPRIGVQANAEISTVKDIILKTVDCERIYLFGSYAYGTPEENSDYDFYVVLQDGDENPVFPVQRIYMNLRQIKRKTPVDILAEHKSRFDDRSLLPTMERKIVREGVLLYDAARIA